MEIRVELDGGATVRLSHQELVRFYNLVNQFVRGAEQDSSIDPKLLEPQRLQLEQLARAVNMP